VVVDCFDWGSRLEYAGDEAALRGMTIMKVVLEEFEGEGIVDGLLRSSHQGRVRRFSVCREVVWGDKMV
jgi:hypothetical protein